MNDLSASTTLVVGASRGLGRGTARAFADAGAPVVAVARTGAALAELVATSVNIHTELADGADPTVAGSLLDRHSTGCARLSSCRCGPAAAWSW